MHLLGEPSRYSLARALDSGGKCVTELAMEVRLSQSCTTRHLQALERERVVRAARAGKRVIYALRRDDPLVAELLSFACVGIAEGSAEPGLAPSSDAQARSEPHVEAGDGDGPSASDDGRTSPLAATPYTEPIDMDGAGNSDEELDHGGSRPHRSDIEDFLL